MKHDVDEFSDDDDECPVCMENQIQSVLPCGHGFCRGCITVGAGSGLPPTWIVLPQCCRELCLWGVTCT